MKEFVTILTLTMMLLAGCGSSFSQLESSSFDGGFGDSNGGMSGARTYTFPEEPSKEQLEEEIKAKNYSSPDMLIQSVFPLLDVVQGSRSNQEARIYVTQRFTMDELSSMVTQAFPPEKESEKSNGKKVLIYPNQFLTFQQSEQDQDAILIELASDTFVRDNYSPDFFTGLFALWVLDEVLDVDDWGKKRRKICASSGCYGGYSSSKYRSGSTGSFRGSSGRGGGPGTGK